MKSLSSLCAATTILIAVQASADPVVENFSRAQGNVAAGSQGIMAINLAAGDSNAQLNASALAISTGLGVQSLQLRQRINFSAIDQAQDSISTIGESAFSNTQGALSVNQVSGVGNAQINAISIGIGLEGAAISDAQLAASTSGQAASTQDDPQFRREARIEGQAFKGSSGLVQVNQLAGTGNATANNFQLSVELGATNQQ